MATEEFKTTRKVALLLGIKPGRLSMALWDRHIPEPKRLGRSCMWTDDDIARAARCFGIKWPRPVATSGPQAVGAPTTAAAVKE